MVPEENELPKTKRRSAVTRLIQSLIKLYAFMISPLIGRSCRFHPTCSAYAHESLECHGPLKGLYLTIRRILRCHPWNTYSFDDPVPKQFAWRDILRYKRSQNHKRTG